MSDARDIYQAHLDEMSRAIWDGDMATMTRLHVFPNVICFPDGDREMHTGPDLHRMVLRFREHLEGLGATGYHRVCEAASFDPADTGRIEGEHRSYIMRGGNYVTEPYSCHMVLRRSDAGWHTAEITVPQLRHGIPVVPRARAGVPGR